MEKEKIKKIGRIAGYAVICVFLAVCLMSVLATVFAERAPDGGAEIFGYQFRIVTSDSMEKCELTDVSKYDIKSIPLRSMVIVETVPDDEKKADEWYGELKVGDVLTFRYVYTSQVTITHRIVSVEEKKTGGYVIELAGDNKSGATDQLTQTIDTSIPNSMNYVIGKVVGQSRVIGTVMSVLKTPAGIIFAVIVPCLAIILYELLKILKMYGGGGKKKDSEEEKKKDEELEELRRRVAELESAGAETAEPEKSSVSGEEEG